MARQTRLAASVAERGLLGQIVPAAAFADAITLNEARSAMAILVGPPVGGALFGLVGALPFLTDAAIRGGFVTTLLTHPSLAEELLRLP